QDKQVNGSIETEEKIVEKEENMNSQETKTFMKGANQAAFWWWGIPQEDPSAIGKSEILPRGIGTKIKRGDGHHAAFIV
ncbi:MAG: hypothetical protein AAGM67_19495, partial [Bacteroidota bacterium]